MSRDNATNLQQLCSCNYLHGNIYDKYKEEAERTLKLHWRVLKVEGRKGALGRKSEWWEREVARGMVRNKR